MKKVVLFCIAALCLAACHCERRTTGTPCRKAACQCAQKAGCKCNQKSACKCHKKAGHQKAPSKAKAVSSTQTAAQAAEKKATAASAELASVGTVRRQGNVIVLSYTEPIRFAHNSDQVDPASYKELNATAAVLKKYPANTVTVKGYTDSLGNPAYNVDLSQRRAKAVANALAARGVNAENITAVGYGAANPVASNKTAEGRAQNRRVELEISVK